jgi:hypothetical protein
MPPFFGGEIEKRSKYPVNTPPVEEENRVAPVR